jgi:mannosyltransferase OCH1-like enzyme
MYKNLLFIIIFIIILIITYYNSFDHYILPNNNSFNLLNYYNLLEWENLLKENNTNKLINYTTKIPSYLKPRSDIPVANKYVIIKNKGDYSDYHFVLYWINNYQGLIIIRRLDNYNIIKPFKLKVYDINHNKFEIFNFDPINKNEIKMEIKCNVELIKTELNNNQLIPKIIIQTAKSNECNMAQHNAVMSFIELNPEYEYMFFDDDACINYIKNNYDDITFETYNKLKPTAYKADLFRACVLYNTGGCYFDIKQINRVPLREFISNDQDLILCQDALPQAFYNALMISIPKHITIKKVIDAIILNTKNKYYGTCSLCPTGPCLLYKLDPHHKTDLINKFNFAIYGHYKIRHKGYIYNKKLKKIIINTSYRGYYKKEDKNNYFNLWFNKDIYNHKT